MSFTVAQDSVFKGNDWWTWSLWIEAPPEELDQVESVTYRLHDTFPDPIRKIHDRASKFRLEAHGWGEFSIPAHVRLKNGETIRLRHELILERPALSFTSALAGARRAYSFISYSRADAVVFAAQLRRELFNGTPPFETWFDQFDLPAAVDASEAVGTAVRDCESVILVLTSGTQPAPEREWRLALEYRKPIILLKVHSDALVPSELAHRSVIDFTGDPKAGIANLRQRLAEQETPQGRLRMMRECLSDAERELTTSTDPRLQRRIAREIDELRTRITEQQHNVEQPAEAARRVEESVERDVERERHPAKEKQVEAEAGALGHLVPAYFQNRNSETRFIREFLHHPSQRLLQVHGSGGIGKSALVLRALWWRQDEPKDVPPPALHGSVYLSVVGPLRITLPALYGGLCALLPGETAANLLALYRQAHVSITAKINALIQAIGALKVLVVLDGLDAVLNPETTHLNESELEQALVSLLKESASQVKVIVTSRVLPRALTAAAGQQEVRLAVEPLSATDADAMMRAVDPSNEAGLQEATAELLSQAYGLTRGNPRAIEALHALLLADSTITPPKLLEEMSTRLTGNPTEALVAEAFSRLNPLAEQVMQALAIYGMAVTAGAIDYLLLPFVAGVSSEPVLRRLAEMHFARVSGERYFLHPVDRNFALRRIPAGTRDDRTASTPRFTQFALLHRAAEYFVKVRTPATSWKSLNDLAPVMMEFELRLAGEDYEAAAGILREVAFDHLLRWGHAPLVAELYERVGDRISEPYLKANAANTLAIAYSRMGRVAESIRVYEGALSLARETDNEGVFFGNLAASYLSASRIKDAIALLQDALKIAEEKGDRGLQATWRASLTDAYVQAGKLELARAETEKSLEIARALPDRAFQAIALRSMASWAFALRDLERATSCYTEALQIAQERGDAAMTGVCLSGISMCQLGLGDFDDAATGYEEVLAIVRAEGDRVNEGIYILNLGICWYCQGRTIEARERFQRAISIAREVGDRGTEGSALENLGMCELILGNTAVAAESLKASWAIGEEIGERGSEGYAKGGLAEVALRDGRIEEAIRLAREAVAVGVQVQSPTLQLAHGTTLSFACLTAGQLREARSAIDAALLHSDPMHQHVAIVLSGLIALLEKDLDAAAKNFDRVLTEVNGLLKLCPSNYRALDSKALAHAGRAVCRDGGELVPALAAFQAARAINRDPGTLTRTRQLFDLLAQADPRGVLLPLRQAASPPKLPNPSVG